MSKYLGFLSNLSSCIMLIVGSQIWECCAYFGLRAILVMFLTSSVGYSDGNAFALYLTMIAMADALSVLGGKLGEYDSARVCFLGSLLMMMGFVLIAIKTPTSYVVVQVFGQPLIHSDFTIRMGTALLATGVALYRPNSFALIGRRVRADAYNATGNDPVLTKARIDSAMALVYSFINIGFIMAFSLVGLCAERFGWLCAFIAVIAAMTISSVLLLYYQYQIVGKNLVSWLFNPKIKRACITAMLSLVLCYLCACGGEMATVIVSACVLATLAYGLRLFMSMSKKEKDRTKVFVAYLALLVVFMAIERQIFTAFPLFFSRNVIRSFAGISIPVTALYLLMPLGTLIFGPINAYFIHHWKSRSILPGIRSSMAFSFYALAHFLLLCSCKMADTNGMVQMWLPVLAIMTFAAAEALFIPAVLSMATRLAPPGMSGVFNGMVFVWVAFGTLVAKPISALMAVPNNKDIDPIITLAIYENGFYKITWIAIICTMIAIATKILMDTRVNVHTHGDDLLEEFSIVKTADVN